MSAPLQECDALGSSRPRSRRCPARQRAVAWGLISRFLTSDLTAICVHLDTGRWRFSLSTPEHALRPFSPRMRPVIFPGSSALIAFSVLRSCPVQESPLQNR